LQLTYIIKARPSRTEVITYLGVIPSFWRCKQNAPQKTGVNPQSYKVSKLRRLPSDQYLPWKLGSLCDWYLFTRV